MLAGMMLPIMSTRLGLSITRYITLFYWSVFISARWMEDRVIFLARLGTWPSRAVGWEDGDCVWWLAAACGAGWFRLGR